MRSLFVLVGLLSCKYADVQLAPCVDLVNPATGLSDCPFRRGQCTDPTYFITMKAQCPVTCGLCGATKPPKFDCADLLNPATGLSDCPFRAKQCFDPIFFETMTVQCPKTCGRCPVRA